MDNVIILKDAVNKKEFNDFISTQPDGIELGLNGEEYKQIYSKVKYSNKVLNINKNSSLYSKKIVGDSMEDNKLLEKYLDKVDQDRRDQEERLNNAIVESEKRNHTERTEFEKRILQDRKDSEERIDKKFNQILSSIEKNNERLEKRISDIENKIESNSKTLENKIDGNNKWIIGVCITTILSIAALVISILVAK
ncbi:hypothetical protein JJB61_11285 [Clostridium perfringens]|uniref:Uncharacterized protein n=1 Tax=Clostridium perfringens TaxID=1502 RepID=A0AAN5SEX3_CLOPF|nr:hypothetical protein [Clostridium perfringens]MDU2660956.1 hypothetical protein [Clostridioides difficile]AQW25687.1 hypothetical protein BXT94_02385 [Clostridium perfringens]ASY50491.1 hypothetical protein BG908_02090 [Clostridium perfringens]AWS24989.1 hypothetical protein CYK96_05080 [Clostridium perfringens]ELC8386356.1 hypothetical protein [Clostridium perfringens]